MPIGSDDVKDELLENVTTFEMASDDLRNIRIFSLLRSVYLDHKIRT
jgi:hypothetical protein